MTNQPGYTCSACGGEIRPFTRYGREFFRHVPNLPYCSDKHPTPAPRPEPVYGAGRGFN